MNCLRRHKAKALSERFICRRASERSALHERLTKTIFQHFIHSICCLIDGRRLGVVLPKTSYSPHSTTDIKHLSDAYNPAALVRLTLNRSRFLWYRGSFRRWRDRDGVGHALPRFSRSWRGRRAANARKTPAFFRPRENRRECRRPVRFFAPAARHACRSDAPR